MKLRALLTWPPLWVGILVTAGLAARRQVAGPRWEPRGADWGMWYASAAWPFHDVQWPPVRWPLWGFSAAFFDWMSPAPLHVDAMLLSMICTGVAAAAVFALVRPLAGSVAAIAAVLLLVLHPMTIEMGGWLGSYAMWAATGPLIAAALATAVRTRSTTAWWVAGVAFGGCLAVQEKGILTAAGMFPAILIALAVTPDRRRALVGLTVPGVVLALAYFVFPGPLASLDAQATLQADGRPAPPPALMIVDERLGQPDAPTATEGWIFGRQMGPGTLVGLAKKGFAPLPEATTRAHEAKLAFVLRESFPGADPRVLVGIGLLAALALLRRRVDGLVGVTALLGVVASGYPALNSDFNLRFVLAPAWALPALLVLGLPRIPLVPALLVAALVGPARVQSSWQWDSSPLLRALDPVGRLTAQVWLDLDRRWPGVPIDVQAPFEGGALAVDGRDGRYLSGLDLGREPGSPDHWLLVYARVAADPKLVGHAADALSLTSDSGAPVAMGRRRIAMTWAKEGGSALWLLTPDAPP